jgi:hypothetical protein
MYNHPFLGFPSFTETHNRFSFAPLVGSHDRWTTFLFLVLFAIRFSGDVELTAMRISYVGSMSWPDVLFSFSWSTVGHDLPDKTAITFR